MILIQALKLFALETMRDRYWHNMAGRIQRAFRNYMRYKHECARRIQRFWKNNKESIEYAQRRDYGHQILADRKERRRFSLLSYRRFMGDYLDINGHSALGDELSAACGLGCKSRLLQLSASFADDLVAETVTFSARGQILVSKLGRSSKPSPRFFIVVRLRPVITCSSWIMKQIPDSESLLHFGYQPRQWCSCYRCGTQNCIGHYQEYLDDKPPG